MNPIKQLSHKAIEQFKLYLPLENIPFFNQLWMKNGSEIEAN